MVQNAIDKKVNKIPTSEIMEITDSSIFFKKNLINFN